MKNTLAWAKTVGSLALGLMVLTPAATYAVDLNLPKTQTSWEARVSNQEGYGPSGRYMEQEERRVQERRMEKKTEEERKQHRNEVRQRGEDKERESSISSRDRHGRFGSGVSVGGGGRSRGR